MYLCVVMKHLLRISLILLAGAFASTTAIYATDSMDVTEAVSERAQARMVRGGIQLSAITSETVHFEIYSITGQLVKAVELRNDSQTIELPNGCYIVKCQHWSKKVLVK